ncbi:MAG TPA: serine hydrolase [Spirochaetota bacterium]|nr:serine hydrolase [Spirochaetota bacterium]
MMHEPEIKEYRFHGFTCGMPVIIMIVLIQLIISVPVYAAADSGDYWPGKEWRTSTPDAQGLSSSKVHSFLRALNATDRLHSVVIIKNGYLVTEAYYHPYHRGAREYMVSLGDCVMSALTGIAAEKYPAIGDDATVVDFFGERTIGNMTSLKKKMTIRDLLTMRAAFDRQWKADASNVSAMMHADDPVSFILDAPMKENTSDFFSYSSLNSHLLSAIISVTTGMSAGEFAQLNCFGPIGITTADWSRDARGISWGGFGLRMSALDMARFGYLYLRGGTWDGKAIVPRRWVESSVKSQVPCSSFPYDSEGFGYQWWIEPWGYSARGMSGHYLFVIPSRDIVVVITSEYQFYTLHQLSGNRYAMFDGELRDGPAKHYVSELVGMYLAETSAGEIHDPSAEKRLAAYLGEIMKPSPVKKSSVPRTAARISGKKIIFNANHYRIKTVILSFSAGGGHITMEYEGGELWKAPIGGNGAFINTVVSGIDEVALRGSWLNSNTFSMEEQEISESERFLFRFTFHGNTVEMKIIGSASNQPVEVSGRVVN